MARKMMEMEGIVIAVGIAIPGRARGSGRSLGGWSGIFWRVQQTADREAMTRRLRLQEGGVGTTRLVEKF